MLLNSACYHFIEDFFTVVYQDYWPTGFFFFSHGVFPGFDITAILTLFKMLLEVWALLLYCFALLRVNICYFALLFGRIHL